MIDLDAPAVRSADPAVEREMDNARNRREGLAAKAEARYPVEKVVGQLGRRVTLQREPHVIRRHPAAVIRNFDEFQDVNDTLGHGVGDELLRAVLSRDDGAGDGDHDLPESDPRE